MRRLSAIVLIIVAFMVSGCQSHSTRSAPEVGRASTPEPTLGKSWGFFAQEGYGTVRPRTIFNGGDPTGQVTAVHWRSWGDQTAVGEGSGVWVPPSNDPSVGVGSDSEDVPAVVVAFRLGWCGKTYMYRAVEWYFPSKGEKFDALHYIDICNGRYVPSP